jgi:hypothetical protein
VEQAQTLFGEWMAESNPEENNPVPADLKQLVYEVAVREGSTGDEFAFLLEQLPKASVPQDVTKIIYGLGASLDESLILTLLGLTIDASGPIRSQDVINVYRAVGATAMGRRVQFQWLQDK